MTTDPDNAWSIERDDLPLELRSIAVLPADDSYAGLQTVPFRAGAPAVILQPATVDELRAALVFARAHPQVPLGIRSAGHGIGGRSTNVGGIVISLSRFDRVSILDEDRRLVRIGPGATWGRVATVLEDHGWALTSGDNPNVGVGGLTTAGGIGFFAREHGLTIDRLRAADVLLADGRQVRADPTENAELFWGIRGGLSNFGIVTAFEFEAHPVGTVGFAQLTLDASAGAAGLLQRWGRTLEASPRTVNSFVTLMPTPGPSGPLSGPAVAIVSILVDSADEQVAADLIGPFREIGTLVAERVLHAGYGTIVNQPPPPTPPPGDPNIRSALVAHLTPELAAVIADVFAGPDVLAVQLRGLGGAVGDVGADETLFSARTANVAINATGLSAEGIDAAWQSVTPHAVGVYLAFDSGRGFDRVEAAYPASTIQRIRALKTEVDPDGLFDDSFALS